MGEDDERQEAERGNKDPKTAILALKIISPQLSEEIWYQKRTPICHLKDFLPNPFYALLKSKVPLFKHYKGGEVLGKPIPDLVHLQLVPMKGKQSTKT